MDLRAVRVVPITRSPAAGSLHRAGVLFSSSPLNWRGKGLVPCAAANADKTGYQEYLELLLPRLTDAA